ncbi:MAG: hypothetical protein IKQ95_09050 [Synergistaceae bacterium]|nr:hypothetical protein [Synergistaceae bacterium]
MPEKNTADLIQSVLEKNKGFMTVKRLADSIGAEGRYALGIKKGDSGKIIQRKIEQSEPGRFMFRAKGNRIYILEPSEPSELVLGLLSEKKAFDTKIIGSLPYTSAEFYAVVNELVDDGRVIIKVSGSFTPKIYRAGEIVRVAISENNTESESAGEYTPEKFREAFDSLDRGRIFVRICDLRRRLGWPREVFDNMLKDLRDREVIQLHTGDASLMTPDEVADCFIDENNFRKGSVTWHVR